MWRGKKWNCIYNLTLKIICNSIFYFNIHFSLDYIFSSHLLVLSILIYYSLFKISFASLKKLSSPQRSKSPIIAKRFFARVAATFRIFAACAAH